MIASKDGSVADTFCVGCIIGDVCEGGVGLFVAAAAAVLGAFLVDGEAVSVVGAAVAVAAVAAGGIDVGLEVEAV